MGTWSGLVSFDGYTFRNYDIAFPDGRLMGNNRINDIAESSTGDIYAISQDYVIYIFDVRQKVFRNLSRMAHLDTQSSSPRRIYPLSNGVTWVTCNNRFCIRLEDKYCTTIKDIASHSHYFDYKKVSTVFQDSKMNEWILTDRGAYIFGQDVPITNHYYTNILETNGTIWLAARNGALAKYDLETAKFQPITIPYNIRLLRCVTPLRDSAYLALGTDAGLLILDTRNMSFQQYDLRTPSHPVNDLYSFYEDSHGLYWMYTDEDGILRFDSKTGKIHYMNPIHNDAVEKEDKKNTDFIMEDPQGYLWMVPKDGSLCYYDRETESLKFYYEDNTKQSSIVSMPSRKYYRDKQGNWWIGSTKNLNKVSFYDRKYQLTEIDNNEFGIRAMLIDQEKGFWTSTRSGVIRIYNKGKSLKGYLSPAGEISTTPCIFCPGIYTMVEDADGRIWIGTKENGIYIVSMATQQVQHYMSKPNDRYSLSYNSVYAIYRDSKYRIWVGCHGNRGLQLAENLPNGKVRFIHANNDFINYPSYYGDNIRYITETENGTILVGSTTGLITFSNDFDQAKDIVFYVHRQDENDPASLSDNDIMSLHADKAGNIYVATRCGGVDKIPASENLLSEHVLVEHLHTDHPQMKQITAMTGDSIGNIWIVSQNIFSKFQPQTSTFEYYETSSFLPEQINFMENTIATTEDGRLLIGSNKGIFEINPYQIKKSNYIPPILFTGMTIQGENRDNIFNDRDQITLQPQQRDISIRFSAVDYKTPNKIRYAYRMEGLEKQWHEEEGNRSANYINLPKGDFRFMVKSTNSDGVWTENTKTLYIKTLPTFWESGWGLALYIVLTLLILATIVYVLNIIFRLRHKVSMEKQLTQVKLKFFTDISHELRTPLTLIATPVEDVLENEQISGNVREQLSIVKENTDRMLHLINQILDFRKIQNNKMALLIEQTEIVSLAGQIMDHFRLIAQDRQIHYKLDCSEKEILLWVDRDKFDKILFNLLSNAFKYTPNGKSITVKIVSHSDRVLISVIDEGIGIPEKKIPILFRRFETLTKSNILQPSSGIGLSMVKELVELHHGHIDVVSKENKGSEFCISFQRGRNHFKKDHRVEFLLSDEKKDVSDDIIKDTQDELMVQTTSSPTEISNGTTEENNIQNQERTSILVVEDNDELRKILTNVLSREYEVYSAENGQKAIEQIQRKQPDMIISDIMMPVMDGLEMVRKLKAEPETCHIPIILLSAKAALDDKIEGLENGVEDYITKPFSSTYLQVRIRSILSQRKQLQNFYLSSLTPQSNEEDKESMMVEDSHISEYDKNLMEKVKEYIEGHIEDSDLVIDDLASNLCLSRTVFYKKIKTLFGLSPINLVSYMRVAKAIQLVETSDHSLSEIAYLCGFNSSSYFTTCFKKQTGMTPTDYKLCKSSKPNK